MHDITAMMADPEAFGFKLVMGPIATDHGTTGLGNAPILKLTDVTVFEREFPGRILAAMNGSSFTVISQRVDREFLRETRIPEGERMATLGPKVINAVLGVRSRGTTTVIVTERVYGLPDGTETKDLTVFKAAWGI
jgi:hypothetical protein